VNFCPAIAVPMTVKMPEPMTAPMPSAVSDHGPSDFCSRRSGSSDSAISLSMDFLRNSCEARKFSWKAVGGQLSALSRVNPGLNAEG